MMFGVFYLCNVLQFVIDRLNQGSFSEQNLVSYTHQGVSHVVFNCGNKLDTVKKEMFKQSLANTIIYISKCKHEIKNFTRIIDYQMQFEPEEPAHETFFTLGNPFKCLMNQNPLVTTDT